MVGEEFQKLSTSNQETNSTLWRPCCQCFYPVKITLPFFQSSDENTRISGIWSYLNSYIAHVCFPAFATLVDTAVTTLPVINHQNHVMLTFDHYEKH